MEMSPTRYFEFAAVFVLAIILVGCNPSGIDVELKNKLQGTCIQTDIFPSGIQLHREITYSANGTFSEHGKRTEGKRTNQYIVSGTWKISEGNIHYEILASSHPGVSVGFKNVNRVVSLDSVSVVMDTPQNRRVVCDWKTQKKRSP